MNRSAVLGLALMGFGGGVANAQLQFEGAWFNETFGSTGAARMDLSLSPPDIVMSMDLDGFVFGIQDPDALVLAGSIDAFLNVTFPEHVDPFYGTVSGTIAPDGSVDIDMFNAGFGSFGLVHLSGTAGLAEIRMRYDIYANASDTTPFATGRIDMDFVPAVGSWSAVAGLGVLCGVRRRRAG